MIYLDDKMYPNHNYLVACTQFLIRIHLICIPRTFQHPDKKIPGLIQALFYTHWLNQQNWPKLEYPFGIGQKSCDHLVAVIELEEVFPLLIQKQILLVKSVQILNILNSKWTNITVKQIYNVETKCLPEHHSNIVQ